MSSATSKLGVSSVTVYYFSMPGSLGRAGPIRMMLEDAGVPYTFEAVQFDKWPTMKQEWMQSGNSPAGCLPVVKMDDMWFSQTPAILIYLADKFGMLEMTAEEKYYAVAVADLNQDWAMEEFPLKFRKEQDKIDAYIKEKRPIKMRAIEEMLKRAHPEGPYVLGATHITHVDIFLYCCCHDLKVTVENTKAEYPRLSALLNAVRSRERIAKFLASQA